MLACLLNMVNATAAASKELLLAAEAEVATFALAS